jgi:hypothetical protein
MLATENTPSAGFDKLTTGSSGQAEATEIRSEKLKVNSEKLWNRLRRWDFLMTASLLSRL